MEVRIPNSNRRRALLLIDVQPKSLASMVLPLIDSIASFVSSTDYAAYVQVCYFADESSMFSKQGNFVLSQSEAGLFAETVAQILEAKGKPILIVQKNLRSCFKGFNSDELNAFL